MIDRVHIKTLGVDPGDTCGWSDGMLHGQMDSVHFLEWLVVALGYQRYGRVAIERFSTRKLTPDSERTLEVVGAIKTVCDMSQVPYGLVNASAREKTMSQVPERVVGRHARDAEAVRLWDLQYGKW